MQVHPRPNLIMAAVDIGKPQTLQMESTISVSESIMLVGNGAEFKRFKLARKTHLYLSDYNLSRIPKT